MSNLVEHTRRELALIGNGEEFDNQVISIVKVFSEMGHSGCSAEICTQYLERLLRFQNLSAITSDPETWMHIDEDVAGQTNLWQCKRNSAFFSNDGGKTYYDVNDASRVLVYALDPNI